MIAATEDSSLSARLTRVHRLEGVTGGSALLHLGSSLLAIHDDAFRLTSIALPELALTPLVLLGDGAPLDKTAKPDFEAAVQTPDKAIHVLGSGAAPTRCNVVRLDLATGSARVERRLALYRCVSAGLPGGSTPNIEGAVVDGDRLVLFHRGVGSMPSAIVDLPLDVLDGAEPVVLASQAFNVGAIGGVPLSLTDASLLPGGRIAFLATAEDTPDPIVDGPVLGSVIGIVDAARRSARWAQIAGEDGRPFRGKAEGLAIDSDGAWILADPDDAHLPSELGRLELYGFE